MLSPNNVPGMNNTVGPPKAATEGCVSVSFGAGERATGRPVPFTAAPRHEGDPARLVADPAKARRVLDWRAVNSDLDVILSSAWAWHCNDRAARGASQPGTA